MALILADRVRDTTTTTGTGTVTLSGTAPTGYQTFGAAIGNGNTTYYTINAGSQWEVGIGTYSSTGPTLSRDTVLASSNSGSLVNFSTGTKDVFVTYPAEKSINYDTNNFVGIGTTSPATILDVQETFNGQGGINYTNLSTGASSAASITAEAGGSYFYHKITRATGVVQFRGVTATTLNQDFNTQVFRSTGGTEYMRIDSSGNVGIGTSSPNSAAVNKAITVNGTSNAIVEVNYGGTRGAYLFSNSSGTVLSSVQSLRLQLNTNDTPRVTVDSSGNVGIGTDTPGAKLQVATPASGSGVIFRYTGGTNNPGLYFTTTEATSVCQIDATGSTGTNILAFATSSAERARIDSSGNVLVGTTTAGSAGFTVNQSSNISFNEASGQSLATIFRQASSGDTVIGSGVARSSTANGFASSYSSAWARSSVNVGYGAIKFFTAPVATVAVGTDVTMNECMRIDSSGNVGIGTSSPSEKLEVYGSQATPVTVKLRNDNAGIYAGTKLLFGNYAGTDTAYLSDQFDGSTFNVRLWKPTAGYMAFGTVDTERMRITSAGDIGIGTSSPGVKLDVNGQIRAASGYTGGYLGINYSSANAASRAWFIYNDFVANGDLNILTAATQGGGASLSRLYIDPSGNVGIGTTSPGTYSAKFVTAGAFGTSTPALSLVNSSTENASNIAETQYWLANSFSGLVNVAKIGAISSATGNQYGALYFSTSNAGAPSERMRINSSGQVLIGTTSSPGSPNAKAVISGTADAGIQLASTSGGGGLILAAPSGGTNFYTYTGAVGSESYTERVRITSGGDLLVGTTSSGYSTSGRGVIEVNGSSNSIVSLKSGGNSTGYLYASYPNFFISNAASGPMIFETGGAEKMRLDASGNLGIGTTSPSYKLDVFGTSSTTMRSYSTGTAASTYAAVHAGTGEGVNSVMYSYQSAGWYGLTTNHPMLFMTNNTERMRIDSSGNLGIGTSSPTKKIMLGGQTGAVAAPLALQFSGDYSNGTTAAKCKIFLFNDGSTNVYGFGVGSNADVQYHSGASGLSDGNHRFYTNDTEKMRITAGGDLLVGTTDAGSTTGTGVKLLPTGYVYAVAPSTTADTYNYYNTTAAAYRFYVNNAGTIYATSTTISAISDIRLKENVRDLDTGLDTILALKPRRFDWKEGKGKDIKDDMGFIAQEVEEVLPALIGDWKAGEGEPDDLKSVKAGDLIPVLVKAIQELTARVAQLEGK